LEIRLRAYASFQEKLHQFVRKRQPVLIPSKTGGRPEGAPPNKKGADERPFVV
jgi:hypothetical protein